jgi:hypothetical protein
MKEHDIEAAFKRLQAPAPDPEVRLRAKRAALEEFARLQAANDQTTSKDEQADTRLSRRASPRGRDHMTWTRNTKWLAAAASACIAVVGLAVVWPMLRDGGGERLLEHTPQVAPPGTDAPVASGGNSTDTAEIMTQGSTASEPAAGLEPGSIPAAAPAPDAQVSVPAESDARHERIAREERGAEPERRESASAKQQAVTGGAAAPGPEEEVVVQGLPSSLQSSVEARRGAGAVADAAPSQPARSKHPPRSASRRRRSW